MAAVLAWPGALVIGISLGLFGSGGSVLTVPELSVPAWLEQVHQHFPKEAIVISSAATACVDFAIRLVPIVIAMAFLGFIPSLNALFILPIVLLVLMLAIGLGFILSVINLVVRDMGNMVAMVMTFGMFLAPILYPPPTREPFSLVNVLNPFSPLLIATQESLAGSTWSHPLAFAMSALLALFLFLLAWRVFRITPPRVA